MTHRQIAAAITLAFLLTVEAWLAWCAWRGFDPAFCDAYRACEWRRA